MNFVDCIWILITSGNRVDLYMLIVSVSVFEHPDGEHIYLYNSGTIKI